MRIRPWRKRTELGGPETRMWPMGRLRSEMDRLFDRFLGDWWGDEPSGGGTWVPDLDVAETEKDIAVRAEMPGLDSKDLRISIAGNVLTISGEKRDEAKEETRGYCRSEIHYGTFQRTIVLPETADPEQVTADYDKGVLTVRIGKKPGCMPRRIEVNSGTSAPAAGQMPPRYEGTAQEQPGGGEGT